MAVVVDQDIPDEYLALYLDNLRPASTEGYVGKKQTRSPGSYPSEAQITWRLFFRQGTICFGGVDWYGRTLWYNHALTYFPSLFYYNVFMKCWLLGPFGGGMGDCPPDYCLPYLPESGKLPTDNPYFADFGSKYGAIEYPALAQRFRPNANGFLGTLTIALCKTEGDARAGPTITIRTARDGSILSSYVVPFGSIEACNGPTFHTYDLTDCYLTQGTDYWIQFNATPLDATQYSVFQVWTGDNDEKVECPPGGCLEGGQWFKSDSTWWDEEANITLHYRLNKAA